MSVARFLCDSSAVLLVLLSLTSTSYSRTVFVQGEFPGTYSPVCERIHTCDSCCQSAWPFTSRAAAGTAVAMAAVTFFAVKRILEILFRRHFTFHNSAAG